MILGRAPINKCSNELRGTAGCEKAVEGSTDAIMGGALPGDNSGALRFVRVEHAGYEIFPGNELNGNTLSFTQSVAGYVEGYPDCIAEVTLTATRLDNSSPTEVTTQEDVICGYDDYEYLAGCDYTLSTACLLYTSPSPRARG